jgi:hypothetical protein
MGTYVDKGYSAPSFPKGGNHGMVPVAPGNVREEGVIAAFLPKGQRRVSWMVSASPGNVREQDLNGAKLIN